MPCAASGSGTAGQPEQHVVAVLAVEHRPEHDADCDHDERHDHIAPEPSAPRRIAATGRDDERDDGDDRTEQQRVRRATRGRRHAERPDPPCARMQLAGQAVAPQRHAPPRSRWRRAINTAAVPRPTTTVADTTKPIGRSSTATILAEVDRSRRDPSASSVAVVVAVVAMLVSTSVGSGPGVVDAPSVESRHGRGRDGG